MMFRKTIAVAAAIVLLSAPAFASTITLWTFEGDTTIPEIGVGSVTFSEWAGNESYFAGNPGRGWSISPFFNVTGTISATNPPPKESFAQFTTSTDGYQNISVSWSHRTTSTAPSNFVFQYTPDGVNWVDVEDLKAVLVANWENFSVNLTGIAGAENNPNFAFRIAADIDPDTGNYRGPGGAAPATGGNWRFDNVLVSGIPFGATGPLPTVGPPSKTTTILGPVTFEVNFDEPVTGFGDFWDVQVNETGSANAGVVTIDGVDGTAGPYLVTLDWIGGFGSLGITVVAGAANSVDTGLPNLASVPSQTVSVVSEPRATIASPSTYFTNSGPVTFPVSFNMEVTGFDSADDILVQPQGTVTVGTIIVEGSGIGPYTVTLDDISGTGTFVIRVAANAAFGEGIGNIESFASSDVIVVEPTGTVTYWDFDSIPPDGDTTTGTLVPVIGSGTASEGPGVTSFFATGFPQSGPLGNNSGWNAVPFSGVSGEISPANPLPKSRYVQFLAGTSGFEDIVVSYWHRWSDTAVNTVAVQYTLDGQNWIDWGVYTAPRGSNWYPYVFDFTTIPAANNNPNFGLRLAADVNPSLGQYEAAFTTQNVSTNGTWRFDFVRVSGNFVGGVGPEVSIPEARNLPDGSPLSICNAILYLNRGSFGYITQPDRATGIRIEGAIGVGQDSTVCVYGTIQTTAGGERYIQANLVTSSGSGSVNPLVAGNKALKTDLMTGLYVTAFGQVKVGSLTGNSYVISDGTDETGIGVITNGAPTVTEGEFVTVTGAAGYDYSRVIYEK